MDLFDVAVREGPEQVLAFGCEEGRGVFLVLRQEHRVGVDRDAAGEGAAAGGVGGAGVDVALLGGDVGSWVGPVLPPWWLRVRAVTVSFR